MRCLSCNVENPDGAKFCTGCGKELGQSVEAVNSKPEKVKKKPGCLKVIGGIFIVLIIIGIIASLSQSPPSSDTTSTTRQSKTTSSPKKLPKVSIENLSFKYDQFAVYVYGEATNNTNSLLSYADFTATFYDADGKILGTGIGNLANLPAHESKTVEIIAVDIQPSRIKEYKVDVGTTLFD